MTSCIVQIKIAVQLISNSGDMSLLSFTFSPGKSCDKDGDGYYYRKITDYRKCGTVILSIYMVSQKMVIHN
jgi:hypothetical protein